MPSSPTDPPPRPSWRRQHSGGPAPKDARGWGWAGRGACRWRSYRRRSLLRFSARSASTSALSSATCAPPRPVKLHPTRTRGCGRAPSPRPGACPAPRRRPRPVPPPLPLPPLLLPPTGPRTAGSTAATPADPPRHNTVSGRLWAAGPQRSNTRADGRCAAGVPPPLPLPPALTHAPSRLNHPHGRSSVGPHRSGRGLRSRRPRRQTRRAPPLRRLCAAAELRSPGGPGCAVLRLHLVLHRREDLAGMLC
jgi:hypothetical protein